MKLKLIPLILLSVFIFSCAPTFEPDVQPDTVTFTSVQEDGYTLYTVKTSQPLTRLLIRFVGENLATNSAECKTVNDAIECNVGSINESYTLAVAGKVLTVLGVGCYNETECFEIRE